MQDDDLSKQPAPSAEKQPVSDGQMNLSPRGTGVMMFVLGSVLSYFFVVSPFLAAMRHAKSVELVDKLAGLGPAFLVGSLPFLICPGKAEKLFGGTRAGSRPTAAGWVYTLIICAVGFLAVFLLHRVLGELGYGSK